jgi:hypothetical protein
MRSISKNCRLKGRAERPLKIGKVGGYKSTRLSLSVSTCLRISPLLTERTVQCRHPFSLLVYLKLHASSYPFLLSSKYLELHSFWISIFIFPQCLSLPSFSPVCTSYSLRRSLCIYIFLVTYRNAQKCISLKTST